MDWPAGEAACVTGAASGIGLGIARALVAAGAKAAPTDVDEGRLAKAAKELTDAGGTVTAVRLDVSDESWATAADRAEEALGPISLLRNVAGVGFTMVLREELRDSTVGVSPLVPGTVASRIDFTAGGAEAKLLGRQPNREVAEADHAVLAAGADPDRVGEQVVEAVRDGRFVIVIHREWRALVRRTHAETEDAYAAFDGRHGPDPTARMPAGGTNPVTA
ncbi:SDR family NAD(P)-dependent oxidoreductase [Streptomyces rubradiris]|uniref:SDR family NAD(P)-dependent oxidoreductase n=1 Tax=Streptomyces rubradiris TaxID=285531 RepID=UPI0036E1DB85